MDAEKWVQNSLAALSLQEKVGQMFFAAISGTFYPDDAEVVQKAEALVRNLGIGGFHIWRGEPYALAALVNRLQKQAKIPLLFEADFEAGTGVRIPGGVAFPPAMAMAATGDTALAREMGRITAAEGRALGIHLVLAPVADINSNPLNPVINTRSFGEAPKEVAAFVRAFIRGVRAGGMLSTAKHFPGHGDTALDTHLVMSTIAADSARLFDFELAPFRAAIRGGVDAIMAAHINLPNFPMEPYDPATLSHRMLTSVLREKLAFDGLIITDALQMQAITHNYTPGYAAVAAIRAGADILLVSPEIEDAIAAVIRAVQQGEIPESRIDASVARILRAKARLGLHRARLTAADALAAKLGRATDRKTARESFRKAVTLLRNPGEILPLHPALSDSQIAVMTVMDTPHGYAAAPFTATLRSALPHMTLDHLDAETGAAQVAAIRRHIDSAALVVVPLFAVVRSGVGRIGFTPELVQTLDALLPPGKRIVFLAFGSPYLAQVLPRRGAFICAYTGHETMQAAAAEALLGRHPITGRIPVSIPSICERGAGVQLLPDVAIADVIAPAPPPVLRMALPEEAGFSRDSLCVVDRVMQQGVDSDLFGTVFPGASLLVARNGLIVRHKSYGRLGYGEFASPVPRNAIYDLASVTKVIATTTAAMLLYDRGTFVLNKPVRAYLPEFAGAGKDSITVRQLLTHCSGLPAFKRYFLENLAPGQMIARILAEPLVYEPGTQTIYSDLGVILIGKIIEKISGQPLDVFCREKIFEPLGMRDTFFNPPAACLPRIAPTERDEWRGRVVHGAVHDENAFALGGVAGHAGLFSTTRDLAKLLQMLLNGGSYNGVKLISSGTIALFTSRQNLLPESTRALGWDTRSAEKSSSGHFMSLRAFGHTGFTGTSIWVDPEKQLFVVLLTNRVHPTRKNRKIIRFRPKLHDAVMRALVAE